MYSVFETYIEEYIQIVKNKDINEDNVDGLKNECEYIYVPTNGRNSQRLPDGIRSMNRIIRVLPILES